MDGTLYVTVTRTATCMSVTSSGTTAGGTGTTTGSTTTSTTTTLLRCPLLTLFLLLIWGSFVLQFGHSSLPTFYQFLQAVLTERRIFYCLGFLFPTAPSKVF